MIMLMERVPRRVAQFSRLKPHFWKNLQTWGTQPWSCSDVCHPPLDENTRLDRCPPRPQLITHRANDCQAVVLAISMRNGNDTKKSNPPQSQARCRRLVFE